ncbi:gamma-glutamyl-gamma-aminobutyrate hydrolase family protein [Candidatus Thioglobus sp.]|nr:gamma-glutamyl-gamma-aminobutyrate hydrolase family protein [Candidatus Thioglobus sp.]
MIIGITQRVDKIDSYNEYRDSLDQRLIDWVIKSGFLPVPIPNTLVSLHNQNHTDLLNWIQKIKINAILLSGGNDIGDIKHRDLTEKYLLSWAEKNKKPVLGICRGMQMMGIYSGVSLKEVGGHIKTKHRLLFEKKHKLFLPSTVNSFHNFSLDQCPEKFDILARSEAGDIEAIKHMSLPWEGWMWHPERESSFNEIDTMRLKKIMYDK